MARITILQHSKDAVEVPAGQVIFNQGDSATNMYVVTEGQVDIVIDGRVVDTVAPGESFGEMALIDNRPRSATAVASVASKVVAVDKARFIFMVTETPNFALQIMGIMGDRLRKHNDRAVG